MNWMRIFILLSLLALSQLTFADDLVIREYPVPENDLQGLARANDPAKIYSVIEDALKAEGFGELEIDSVEWRESIPSERRKSPYRVVRHEELTAEEVGGSPSFYLFTVDSVHTPVFRFAVNDIQKNPYRFRIFDEGWVLEVKSHRSRTQDGWGDEIDFAIFVNGIEQNQYLGFDACWGYRHIGEQPFLFFERDGKTGWSYDGIETIFDYEIVVHNRCCKDVLMNPHFFYNAVTFFAQRDGLWYQVVGMINPDQD